MGYNFASPPPVELPFRLNKKEAIPLIQKALSESRLQKQVNPTRIPSYASTDGPCAVGVCLPGDLAEWIDGGNVEIELVSGPFRVYGVRSLELAGVIESDCVELLGEVQVLHDARDFGGLETLLATEQETP